MFPITRLRRLRQTPQMREFARETTVTLDDLIYPIFVEENTSENSPIESMPGQMRIAEKNLATHIKGLYKEGIKSIILFGISKNKDETGSDSLKKTGLLSRMISQAKEAQPEMLVISDNCFCEYTSHGHCGILKKDKNGISLDNDATLELLAEQALVSAEAGADIVAPSAMMDGQIQAIRKKLDENNFQNTPIMSYSTKFCSSFYGPFREAADSHLTGDRKTYQMSYMNKMEALRESLEDENEGADFLMVKPAGLALDIIAHIRTHSLLPLFAYQVSGEYAAIKFAAKAKVLNENDAIIETLTAIKRAGASKIITYFAPDFAKFIKNNQ